MTTLFDQNGFCLNAGNVVIYNFSPLTREFINPSEEYIPVGVSLPAASTLHAPPDERPGYAICWDGDNSLWEYIEDNRGQIIYSMSDASLQTVVSTIGPVPDGYTLLVPATVWDVFTDGKWVTSTEKRLSALSAELQTKRNNLITHASAEIAWLSDAVELSESQPGEEELLKDWKLYRISLSRLDLSDPDAVVFPTLPGE